MAQERQQQLTNPTGSEKHFYQKYRPRQPTVATSFQSSSKTEIRELGLLGNRWRGSWWEFRQCSHTCLGIRFTVLVHSRVLAMSSRWSKRGKHLEIIIHFTHEWMQINEHMFHLHMAFQTRLLCLFSQFCKLFTTKSQNHA